MIHRLHWWSTTHWWRLPRLNFPTRRWGYPTGLVVAFRPNAYCASLSGRKANETNNSYHGQQKQASSVSKHRHGQLASCGYVNLPMQHLCKLRKNLCKYSQCQCNRLWEVNRDRFLFCGRCGLAQVVQPPQRPRFIAV